MFSWICGLFRKREPPQQIVEHPVLGRLEWRVDEDSWVGAYSGYRFSLMIGDDVTPNETLASYAIDVMSAPGWLEWNLEEAKTAAVEKYERFYSDEIAGLTLGDVAFFRYKQWGRIMATLEGGRNFRCWRIEFTDKKCEGIGFDT
jgi:hypothetical protein